MSSSKSHVRLKADLSLSPGITRKQLYTFSKNKESQEQITIPFQKGEDRYELGKLGPKPG